MNVADKIRALKRMQASDACIDQSEWNTADRIITEVGGSRVWERESITVPHALVRAALIAEMPVLQAKSDKQRAYGESMRLQAVMDMERRYPRPSRSGEIPSRKYGAFGEKLIRPVPGVDRETGIRTLIRAMGVAYTDARSWIDFDVADLANDETARGEA